MTRILSQSFGRHNIVRRAEKMMGLLTVMAGGLLDYLDT